MRILLAGDSWGIGVFKGQGSVYGPTGQGIHTLLEAQGHTVINISKGGGANWLMIDRLNGEWDYTGRCLFGVEPNLKIDIDFNNIDYIIFLQTDIFRERHYYGKQYPTDTTTNWKILEQEFVDSLIKYDSIDSIVNSYFQNFYKDLNNIGIEHNKKILMVGGWSQLHPSITDYSNLIPAVISATKLLIPEVTHDGYISDPEWFSQLDKEKPFMEKFGNEFKQLAIYNADKLNLVYKNWKEVHPPIEGYQSIVDKLLPYLAKKY
jgi:hypothetical protein